MSAYVFHIECCGLIDVESEISIKTQQAALKTSQKILRKDIEDVFSFDKSKSSDSDRITLFPTIPMITEST